MFSSAIIEVFVDTRTFLVEEKHVDCKWIDAEREKMTTIERKIERNKENILKIVTIVNYSHLLRCTL